MDNLNVNSAPNFHCLLSCDWTEPGEEIGLGFEEMYLLYRFISFQWQSFFYRKYHKYIFILTKHDNVKLHTLTFSNMDLILKPDWCQQISEHKYKVTTMFTNMK